MRVCGWGEEIGLVAMHDAKEIGEWDMSGTRDDGDGPRAGRRNHLNVPSVLVFASLGPSVPLASQTDKHSYGPRAFPDSISPEPRIYLFDNTHSIKHPYKSPARPRTTTEQTQAKLEAAMAGSVREHDLPKVVTRTSSPRRKCYSVSA